MGEELLAWLFEYKIFLLADIIEQGWAKRMIALCSRFSTVFPVVIISANSFVSCIRCQRCG